MQARWLSFCKVICKAKTRPAFYGKAIPDIDFVCWVPVVIFGSNRILQEKKRKSGVVAFRYLHLLLLILHAFKDNIDLHLRSQIVNVTLFIPLQLFDDFSHFAGFLNTSDRRPCTLMS